MAAVGATVLTLSDWAKRRDPKGGTAVVAELLSQQNSILDDMLFKEGNLPTGDQATIRTGLPTSYYRLINQGVPKAKSTTAQITEQASILEARSEVDVDIANLEADVNGFRLSESMAFLESMNQQQASTLIYGTASNPEEYVGLAPRCSSLSAGNAANILDAGGSGSDNTSIFLCGWGANSMYGIFPKGSKAGLLHEDLGIGDAFDSNNYRFRAYMDRYQWKNGLMVRDWRYLVRICNIDVSDLVGLSGTQELTDSTLITKLMSRAIDRLPNLTGIKPAFYCNRTVGSLLRVAAAEKSSSVLSIEEGLNQFGQTIFTTKFLGIPVRIVDQILNTETRVV
jgi:hypothetical protein